MITIENSYNLFLMQGFTSQGYTLIISTKAIMSVYLITIRLKVYSLTQN